MSLHWDFKIYEVTEGVEITLDGGQGKMLTYYSVHASNREYQPPEPSFFKANFENRKDALAWLADKVINMVPHE